MVHEVVNELDNIPNFNGVARHKTIDWLTENFIKLAIIKTLSLDRWEGGYHISSFIPWCQIRGTFDIKTSILMLHNMSFFIFDFLMLN